MDSAPNARTNFSTLRNTRARAKPNRRRTDNRVKNGTMRRVLARQNYHNTKVDVVNARCRERTVSRAIRNFAGFREPRDRRAEKMSIISQRS